MREREPVRSVSKLDGGTKPITILLTGFFPFPRRSGLDWNVTQELVERLGGRRLQNREVEVIIEGLVLPVVWFDAIDELRDHVDETQPHAVLALGMKPSDPLDPESCAIEIEAFALNENRQDLLDEPVGAEGHGELPREALHRRCGVSECRYDWSTPSTRSDDHRSACVNLRRGTLRPEHVLEGPARLPPESGRTKLPLERLEQRITSREGATPAYIDRSDGTGSYLCNQVHYALHHHSLASGGERPVGFFHVPSLMHLPRERRLAELEVSLLAALGEVGDWILERSAIQVGV